MQNHGNCKVSNELYLKRSENDIIEAIRCTSFNYSQHTNVNGTQSRIPSSTSSSSSSSKSFRRRACCSSLFFFCHILNKSTEKPTTATKPRQTMATLSPIEPLEEPWLTVLLSFLVLNGSLANPWNKNKTRNKENNLEFQIRISLMYVLFKG